MATVIEKQEECDTRPPAYTSTAVPVLSKQASSPPAASSSAVAPPPLAAPRNFLTIYRQRQSINGVYIIDPSLPMPPDAVRSFHKGGGEPLHLLLKSLRGSVDAVVELVRDEDVNVTGPARLEATSSANVTVTVRDSHLIHFHLFAMSEYDSYYSNINYGNITLHLPRTYTGPLFVELEYGELAFSTAVQARLTMVSEYENKINYFVGDFAGADYRGVEEWLGDSVTVKTFCGRVKVDFTDENGGNSKGVGKEMNVKGVGTEGNAKGVGKEGNTQEGGKKGKDKGILRKLLG